MRTWVLRTALCSGGQCFHKRQAPHRGSNRVKRGGSWNNNARNCRSANRNNNNPDNRNNNIGFRLAKHTQWRDLTGPRTGRGCLLCPGVCRAPAESRTKNTGAAAVSRPAG
ncbi:SUMF1/EgtB/PvdO family nonheme iron enzyme [bacterium]|nr:SUMF1/EgtB/PvdO family nonheme iron enzyme [bacterium]